MSDMLDAALSYADRGWRVIPLWEPVPGPDGALICTCAQGQACGKSTGKHPIHTEWPTLATIDPKIITQWWQRWPNANIGIVAGGASGVAMLDCDPRNGGEDSLTDLQKTHGQLPDTTMALSGGFDGGQHQYFAITEDLPSVDLAPGLNFQADTYHLVVAPPSLHRSGRRYTWELSSEPDDVPPAPLPDWIRTLAYDKQQELTVAAATLPDTLPAIALDTLKVSRRMKRIIQQGDDIEKPYRSRSEALFGVIQAMIRAGHDDATIAGVVLDPTYGISSKPLTQKNPRSPMYWTLTRGWVAKEIARCRTKHKPRKKQHVPPGGMASPPPEYEAPAGEEPTGDDCLAKVQELYHNIQATPEAERTIDVLYTNIALLASIPPDQWPLWKDRFKLLFGKRLNLNDFQGAIRTVRKQQARASTTGSHSTEDKRPIIRITPDITAFTNKGQDVLLQLPDAPIYQRARHLVVLSNGGQAPKWLRRPPDLAAIVELTPAHLRELASQAARFETYSNAEESFVEITVPTIFLESLLGRPGWRFPLLEGVLYSPSLRPDGSVLDRHGYDPASGFYLDLSGTHFPPLLQRPTLDDARSALRALKDALYDFPFVHAHDQSAALAACLSMACRLAIQGCIPLFAVTAPTRGSGKSMLVDAMSLIGTGRPAARWPQVVDPDEERKRILSVALAGYPAIHIDNVVHPLGSPALDLALTSSTYTDRILGKTGDIEAPLHLVWLASGNNMRFAADTARRTVPIEIDPGLEFPEQRTGFQHTPLLPWLLQERPRLTIACLTAVQAFFAAGCPHQGLPPFGSFEAWSDLIRQTLVWAGEADPCEGRKTLEATTNPEFESHANLLHCWHACYAETKDGVTLRKIAQDLALYAAPDGQPPNHWNELRDAFCGCDSRSDGTRWDHKRVGNTLRSWQGRIIDGLRLVVLPEKDRKGVALWKLFGEPTSAGSAGSAGSVSLKSKNEPPLSFNGHTSKGVGYTVEKEEEVTQQDPADPAGRNGHHSYAFADFTPKSLFCASCKTPTTPVLHGDFYHCAECNSVTGERIVRGGDEEGVII